MNIYADPEVLGARVRSRLKVPFQVTFTIKGYRDMLVLDGTEELPMLQARRKGQSDSESRSWGSSEFNGIPHGDVLAKLRPKIGMVTISRGEGRRLATFQTFPGWPAFLAWLEAGPEPVVRTTILLPESLAIAARKRSTRKRTGGQHGSFNDIIKTALRGYLERQW